MDDMNYALLSLTISTMNDSNNEYNSDNAVDTTYHYNSIYHHYESDDKRLVSTHPIIVGMCIGFMPLFVGLLMAWVLMNVFE